MFGCKAWAACKCTSWCFSPEIPTIPTSSSCTHKDKPCVCGILFLHQIVLWSGFWVLPEHSTAFLKNPRDFCVLGRELTSKSSFMAPEHPGAAPVMKGLWPATLFPYHPGRCSGEELVLTTTRFMTPLGCGRVIVTLSYTLLQPPLTSTLSPFRLLFLLFCLLQITLPVPFLFFSLLSFSPSCSPLEPPLWSLLFLFSLLPSHSLSLSAISCLFSSSSPLLSIFFLSLSFLCVSALVFLSSFSLFSVPPSLLSSWNHYLTTKTECHLHKSITKWPFLPGPGSKPLTHWAALWERAVYCELRFCCGDQLFARKNQIY